MKFEYQYSFELPRNLVWKWLKSEKVLRNSIIGCKSFTEHSNGVYKGELDIQFGPFQDVFTLEIRRIQERIPSYGQLQVKGKGKLGEIHGRADLFLTESSRATQLSVQADFELNGTLAIAANQMKDEEKNRVVGKFMQRLEKEIKKGIYQSRKSGRG